MHCGEKKKQSSLYCIFVDEVCFVNPLCRIFLSFSFSQIRKRLQENPVIFFWENNNYTRNIWRGLPYQKAFNFHNKVNIAWISIRCGWFISSTRSEEKIHRFALFPSNSVQKVEKEKSSPSKRFWSVPEIRRLIICSSEEGRKNKGENIGKISHFHCYLFWQ